MNEEREQEQKRDERGCVTARPEGQPLYVVGMDAHSKKLAISIWEWSISVVKNTRRQKDSPIETPKSQGFAAFASRPFATFASKTADSQILSILLTCLKTPRSDGSGDT